MKNRENYYKVTKKEINLDEKTEREYSFFKFFKQVEDIENEKAERKFKRNCRNRITRDWFTQDIVEVFISATNILRTNSDGDEEFLLSTGEWVGYEKALDSGEYVTCVECDDIFHSDDDENTSECAECYTTVCSGCVLCGENEKEYCSQNCLDIGFASDAYDSTQREREDQPGCER